MISQFKQKTLEDLDKIFQDANRGFIREKTIIIDGKQFYKNLTMESVRQLLSTIFDKLETVFPDKKIMEINLDDNVRFRTEGHNGCLYEIQENIKNL